LSGCWDFLTIGQPEFADPNSSFDVPITVSLTAADTSDEGNTESDKRGYFGIRLPLGWSVHDSIYFSGVINGLFTYSKDYSDSLEVYDKSAPGYSWWAGISDSIDHLPDGNISFTARITTDNQSGVFLIDYILTDRLEYDDFYASHRGPCPISVNAPMEVTVTNTNDAGQGSLRQALREVSSRGEITFDLAYPATIVLDSALVINRNLTITGSQEGELTISGNDRCRIFNISSPLNSPEQKIAVNLSNIMMVDGGLPAIFANQCILSANSISIDHSDGGISCDKAELSLTKVSITNCGNSGVNCLNSLVRLSDVKIAGNSGLDGGGLYCRESRVEFLSNVTICRNVAGGRGGGISCVDNSNLIFNTEQRSNIYLNHAPLGNDLYYDGENTLAVVLDTFTVLKPTGYFAYPANFTFDILHARMSQFNHDLYVSQKGNDENSGTNPLEPLKTINFALSRILADSLNPHTIYIDNGLYSPISNQEVLPIYLLENVSLAGKSRDGVIIDADRRGGCVFIIKNTQGIELKNMTVSGGANGSYSYGEEYGGGGINCEQSRIKLTNLTIRNNDKYSGSESHGAGLYLNKTTADLENVIIKENTDSRYGGGIGCRSSVLNLKNVSVENNTAYMGGGIHLENSTVNCDSVIISTNRSYDSGGGIGCDDSSKVNSIKNLRIINNRASDHGGGIYGEGALGLSNTTICNNRADESGGGIFIDSLFTLGNVSIYYNVAGQSGGGIYLTEQGDLNYFSGPRANIYLNYAEDSSPGRDLYKAGSNSVTVILDTFTVLAPTDKFAYPIEKFNFDILHNPRGLTDINEEAVTLPKIFALKQNFPNPFNPLTTIEYALPKSAYVKILVYTITGQKVRTLLDKKRDAGSYKLEFDGGTLSSGVYLYRIEAGEYVDVKKMVLIK